jgi:hypothetical protein
MNGGGPVLLTIPKRESKPPPAADPLRGQGISTYKLNFNYRLGML